MSNLPVEKTYLMDPESGANLVTIPTIHSLDALCYLLGEFKFFNANIATTFPELRYIQADGTKGKPIKNNGADSISIQGVLESGASATYMFSSTSEATPAYFEWIIFGEEGSLKFRGPNHLMAMAPHTLYRSAQPKRRRRKEGKGGGGGGLYATKEAGKWEEVEVGTPGPFGGIGEVYAAFAKGDKDLVDFDGAVRRHRMVEAIFRSSKSGTRESY